MASKYTNIEISEMRNFLKPEKGWKENNKQHKETVFDYNLIDYPFILIRVYSGIKTESGQSRACGRDAIRVCAVNLKTNKGWIGAARVYRVEGWQNNLKNRVLQVISEAKERIKNPKSIPLSTPVLTNKDLRGEQEVLRIESYQH